MKKNKLSFLQLLLIGLLPVIGLFSPINSSVVLAADPEAVSVEIPIKQSFCVSGQTTGEIDNRYQYELTTLKPDSPMPEGTNDKGKYSFYLTGNEKSKIGSINYTHGGIYQYQIKPIAQHVEAKYNNDMSVYQVTVAIKNQQNGSLAADLIISNDEGKCEGIEYNHTFKGEAEKTQKHFSPQVHVATGDHADRTMLIYLAIMFLAMVIIVKAKRASHK